jgi:hypothetical protein
MTTLPPFPWRQQILDDFRARVDHCLEFSPAIPVQAGGWWHQYVCPEHELPLIYDPTCPQQHLCPRGERLEGQAYDAAFRVFAHRHVAALARDAALLYRATSQPRYSAAAIGILVQYAKLYPQFDPQEAAQSWMLRGKAFSQALTEAIWVVPLVQAFHFLRPALDPLQLELIQSQLLFPVAQTLSQAQDDLVFQQGRLQSNYNAWLIAALGCLGLALEDKALVERALYSPSGFYAHLQAAVLPDGFEHEGTPYYHNFVALAYTTLAEFALSFGVDLYRHSDETGRSIQGMWSALAALAWPDGSLPCIGDGSYWQDSIFDAELAEVYEAALARTGSPHYAWLLDRLYRRGCARRDSWAAFLLARRELASAPAPALGPAHLPEVGLAILRDPAQTADLAALLRYGFHAGEHTHFDCLALLLYPLSEDAGNPPYAARSRQTWYRQSAAHNTVLVDGCSQQPCAGRLLSWTAAAGRCSVWAAADDAYPGVTYSRRVSLEASRISDESSLAAAGPRTFDWLFHTDVEPCFENLSLAPAAGALFPAGAGSALQLVAEAKCQGAISVRYAHSRAAYRLELVSAAPLAIFLARSPQPGGRDTGNRYTLIARIQSQNAGFFARYEKT